ncbi:MAG: hypothetical protein CSA22_06545 [Deltaproteobacteria bacterium]|nr:MAG: hypothetical protein CSA22_06545 [Deltaproteobacteria bacterium]
MESRETTYRVEKKDIGYIRYIVEASDGIGTVTTLNAADGLILIRTAPGCEAAVHQVITGLSEEIRIEPSD